MDFEKFFDMKYIWAEIDVIADGFVISFRLRPG